MTGIAKWMMAVVALTVSAAGGQAQVAPGSPATTSPPAATQAADAQNSAGGLATLIGEPREGRADEVDEIETDRDSFTPASTLVGKHRTAIEAAYSFLDNRRVDDTHSLPELLVRHGLTDWLELRFGFNYEVGGGGNEISSSAAAFTESPERPEGRVQETKVSYGVKLRVAEQRGWLPRAAVILQGATPTGGTRGTNTATQLTATGVAGWDLPNRWRFDTAFRYGTASEEGDRFNRWSPSAVVRVPVGERWAVHAEYFSTFTTGRAENAVQHYFSPGAHVLLSSDLEVGVRVGWGLNDRSVPFFTNVGFGWRF